MLDIDYVQMTGLDLSFSETERHPLPNTFAALGIQETQNTPSDSIVKEPFNIRLGEIAFENNKFRYHNFKKSAEGDPLRTTVDLNHLDLSQINIRLKDLAGDTQNGFKAKLENLSANEYSGFVISSLSADTLRLKSTEVDFEKMKLVTPYSDLGNLLSFQFADLNAFKDFTDKVTLGLTLEQGKYVGFKDIMFFSPALVRNTFFQKNAQKIVHLEGKFKGKVNRLRGDDIVLALDNQTNLAGSFTLLNAAKSASELSLLLSLDYLNTTVPALRNTYQVLSPLKTLTNLAR